MEPSWRIHEAKRPKKKKKNHSLKYTLVYHPKLGDAWSMLKRYHRRNFCLSMGAPNCPRDFPPTSTDSRFHPETEVSTAKKINSSGWSPSWPLKCQIVKVDSRVETTLWLLCAAKPQGTSGCAQQRHWLQQHKPKLEPKESQDFSWYLSSQAIARFFIARVFSWQPLNKNNRSWLWSMSCPFFCSTET